MGESKFREAGNGDREMPTPISSHIVDVEDFSADLEWGPGIEKMYTRLAERAKEEDSIIVNMVQFITVVMDAALQPRAIVFLTAQRISREDLERQQRLAQFGPGGGPRR